jgi:hypothetical protein
MKRILRRNRMLVVNEKELAKVLGIIREQSKGTFTRVFVENTKINRWKKLTIKVYKNRQEFEKYRRKRC